MKKFLYGKVMWGCRVFLCDFQLLQGRLLTHLVQFDRFILFSLEELYLLKCIHLMKPSVFACFQKVTAAGEKPET